MMLISKRSIFTGVTNHMQLDVTQEQLDKWKKGMLIQKAMPQLTSDEREFLITGSTPEEWISAMGAED